MSKYFPKAVWPTTKRNHCRLSTLLCAILLVSLLGACDETEPSGDTQQPDIAAAPPADTPATQPAAERVPADRAASEEAEKAPPSKENFKEAEIRKALAAEKSQQDKPREEAPAPAAQPTKRNEPAPASSSSAAPAAPARSEAAPPSTKSSSTATSSAPVPLQPYNAVYRITQGGISAEANRSLSKAGDHWRLTQQASKWFITIAEESLIEVTDKGDLRPLRYRYDNSVSSKKNQRIEFDWQAGHATDKEYRKPYSLPLKEDYSDQLSAQLQLRQRLLSGRVPTSWQQTIVKNGKVKTYKIEVLGEEVLSTDLGKVDTVKLRRTRKGSSAETLVWLAKEWNYLIAKLEQLDDDDSLSLELISGSLDGQALKRLTER